MAKDNGSLTELIVMILVAIFLYDCVFHDYNDTMAHKFLVQQGISQKISAFEYKMKNR